MEAKSLETIVHRVTFEAGGSIPLIGIRGKYGKIEEAIDAEVARIDFLAFARGVAMR